MELMVLGGGAGGIAELQQLVDESKVQWALIRFELGSGSFTRNKVLFLHVNGRHCPALQRGRANAFNGDVQRVLRGHGDETFHASLEIEARAEVAAEQLLSRVHKFFVVDDGDISVELLLKAYEENIRGASRLPAACSPPVATKAADGADRIWRRPGHNSMPCFTSGRAALQAVAEPLGAWNWALVRPDPDELPLVGGGSDSVEEMRECVAAHDQDVLFGLLRMGFGEGRLRRTKYVFVHAVGSRVPAVKKGRLSAARAQMERALALFENWSVAIEVADAADLNLEHVIERVRRAAVVDDDMLEGDKGGKSIFSVEHFREALKEEQHLSKRPVEAEDQAVGMFPRVGNSDILGKTVEEVVKLVHMPSGSVNWALFGLNGIPSSARTSIAMSASSSVGKKAVVLKEEARFHTLQPTDETGSVAPTGGFLAAKERARLSKHAPLNPANASDAEESPMKVTASCPPIGNTTSLTGPLRLSGSLLKKSPALFARWQLRYFEVRAGKLRWWLAENQAKESVPPKGELDLKGLQVKKHSDSRFDVRTLTGKRTYIFDADVSRWTDTGAQDLATWIKALEQESIYARRQSVG